MSKNGLLVRNLLTGRVVDWEGEETLVHDEQIQGVTLAWNDLCVYRRKKLNSSFWRPTTYEHVKILDGVSGLATQGNFIAIMGSSGSGKTTLMAALSQRDASGTTGTVLLNGRPAAPALARLSGFVPQQELTIDDLNVHEHMTFMARMMMDRRCNASTRSSRVQQLLSEFSVAHCVSTKLNALSGGERKRVSLAVQLLNDPPILFCDEPTTGLDSWSASAVITRLRRLAATGKLIMCTIHQPASGVFEMFDRVIFLAAGRVAFQGSIKDAATFFSRLGFKCPVGFNQAEYYVSLVCIAVGQEAKSHDRVKRICNEFKKSEFAADINRKIELKIKGSFNAKNSHSFRYQQEADQFQELISLKKVGGCVQFYWCMWRDIVAFRRSYYAGLVDIAAFLIIGLMVATPYIGVMRDMDQRDIQNIEGLMYLVVTEIIFTYIYNVFMTFPRQLPAFLRESADGLYYPAPYYLSKIMFWIPRAIVVPVTYAVMIFLIAGLHGGATSLFWLTFISVLSANTANAYGFFLSGTFESIETAALVSVPADQIGVMFSGLFINLESLPPAVSWIRYLSPFYYGTEAVSIIQWQAVTHINCVDVPGIPCLRTGADVLTRYGYRKENFWVDVFGLCALYCGYNLIAYVMVKRRSKRAAVY